MAYRVGPQEIVPSPGTYSAHGEWHHDLVRKSVRRCCGASALIVCPGCGQRVLFVASTLVTSSVTTKVSNK